MLCNSITDIIGKTPLLKADRFVAKSGVKAEIFVKLDYLNPTGSAKDRAALFMIEDAEKKGEITPGGTIIEPTSGNTGIGLSAIAAAKGYKAIITMPESMSEERKKLMRAYGAELVLTPAAQGMKGAIDKAEEIKRQTPNAIIAGQFVNPANPKAHFMTTGPEIWDDLDGKVDIFVAGIGTGGTITGVGQYLKSKNPLIKIVAVEPFSSPLLSQGKAGPHGLQGIGANFVPEILDKSVYDEIITVKEKDAFDTGRLFVRSEGILIGITSGAALFAACEIARRKENIGKRIVAFLPDTGDRYLSTPMYQD